MFHCARYGRRVREQILAFGVPPRIDRKSPTCVNNNIDNSTKIPVDGLLLYPVAIRAPTAHKAGKRDDVTLMTSLLSNPFAPSTLISLLVCFHITRRMHLRASGKKVSFLEVWKLDTECSPFSTHMPCGTISLGALQRALTLEVEDTCVCTSRPRP